MPTTFETAILATSPVINLDGNQDVSDNTTSDGSSTDTLTPGGTVGTPGTGPTGAGDVTYNFNNAGYWESGSLPSALSNDTTGTMLLSYNVTDVAAAQYLFSTGRKSSGAQSMYVRPSNSFQIGIVPNGFSVNSYFASVVGLDTEDDQWHFVVIRQKADGTGIEIYVDGSWQTVTDAVDGTATINDWFSSFDLAVVIDTFRLGRYSGTTTTNLVTGEMSHFAIWSTALSDSAIDDLYQDWLGGPFVTKTIRRQGRRLFSANL